MRIKIKLGLASENEISPSILQSIQGYCLLRVYEAQVGQKNLLHVAVGGSRMAIEPYMVVSERVMGFEPTNGSLGSYCLTTWRHPLRNLRSIF